MTLESEIAKKASYQFECKKDALRQVQDGGVKVTFSINPIDMPPALYGDMMGQRYMAVIVPINDDETPKLVPDASKDALLHQSDLGQGGNKPKSFAGHGKMLAQLPEFQEYCDFMQWNQDTSPEQHMKATCGIHSCSELIDGSEAFARFERLWDDFNGWNIARHQERAYAR